MSLGRPVAVYDLRPVEAPVLRGWLLAIFTWVLHSPPGGGLLALLQRKTGIVALRRTRVSEPLTYVPIWPANEDKSLGSALKIQDLAGLGAQARADTAADCLHCNSGEFHEVAL